MALWLCRLDPDGLGAARGATDQARRLGIGAWVLPLQSGTELDAGLDALREVYGLDGGLPLLVEWTIREPCSLAEEQRVIGQLAPLLQSARALLLEQRPVLLLKGTQHLAQPEHSAQRLRLARVAYLSWSAMEGAATYTTWCSNWVYALISRNQTRSLPSRRLHGSGRYQKTCSVESIGGEGTCVVSAVPFWRE